MLLLFLQQLKETRGTTRRRRRRTREYGKEQQENAVEMN